MEKLKAYLTVNKLRSPQWLDDTRFIYSNNKSGVPQVWMGDVTTGKETQLSDYEDFITTIVSDSKNNRYVFSMAEGGNERSQIFYGESDTTPTNISNESNAVHMLGCFIPNTDKVLFTSNLRDPNHFDLETLDVKTNERSLILENNDHYNFIDSVSPDGRFYLYRKLHSQSDQPLWCFDSKLKTATNLSSQKAQYGNTAWIDDTSFYYLTNADSEFMHLRTYDIKSKTDEKCLELNWDIESLAISFDKQYLSLIVNEEGYLDLVVLDTNTLKPIQIETPPRGSATFYDAVSWSHNSHQLLLSHSSGTHVSNIWLVDVNKKTSKKVTNNALVLGQEDLVEPILKRFESFDGLSVPYWLYVPKGKPIESLPVMIEIHGGPEGQQTASFDELIAYIVSEGIAVVAPNVRGSTGYGKTYTHLDDVEKRLDSVKDIEYLVKHLTETNIADPDKIAVSGTSYGGFMTLSCAARYPDLFCAAVDTVGMYNLVTFLERTAGYRRAHRESEYGSLEHHRDILFDVSPAAKVDNIKGPLMIIHGTNDPRVPVYEAKQVYEYLKDKDVEVQFLEYEDEGHGLHKLKNRLDCYPKVVEFLHDKMNIKEKNL